MYFRRTVREITDDTIWIQAEQVPSMGFIVDELCRYHMVTENTLLIHPGVVPASPFPSTVVEAGWRGWREGGRLGGLRIIGMAGEGGIHLRSELRPSGDRGLELRVL